MRLPLHTIHYFHEGIIKTRAKSYDLLISCMADYCNTIAKGPDLVTEVDYCGFRVTPKTLRLISPSPMPLGKSL